MGQYMMVFMPMEKNKERVNLLFLQKLIMMEIGKKVSNMDLGFFMIKMAKKAREAFGKRVFLIKY